MRTRARPDPRGSPAAIVRFSRDDARPGAAYVRWVKLRDIVDLEAQLALDEGQDEADLRARDRNLYLAMSPAPGSAEALLVAWLAALRERFGGPGAGERVAAAQRILSYALALAGLSTGWGVAELLLHYEQGGAPVNVGYALLVLVFGQLATLLLLAIGLLLRSLWPQLPLVGDITRLLRFAATRVQRLLRDEQPAASQRLEAGKVAYHRIRTRLGLYERVERYLLLSQTQLFAVAFNLGALASCLRLILLSDLAFSWSTSVTSLSAAEVQRLCAILAWPFAWLVPDALPTPALIEQTQYFRLEGRFSGAAAGSRGNAALAGEWWRFLIACTVSYGLLPRLATYALFFRKYRRAERSVPLDTPAVQRVLSRLTSPLLSTRGHELVAQAAEPAHRVQALSERARGATTLLLYRDIPTDSGLLTRAVAQRFGLEVVEVRRAGGLDVQADGALCKALAQAESSVTLLAEAWEAPDKSLRQLLASLREALGPRRTLRVVLIGEASARGFAAPAAEDVRVYRDRLTLLEDPYLIVDTLPASTGEASQDEVRP